MKFYILSGVYNTDCKLSQAEKEAIMPGHIAFVESGVKSGNVLFGGPRANGESGMIVVRAESEKALAEYIATDPMVINGVQHYDITEFLPKEHLPCIETWLN